jgi:hypothetical protein
MAKMADFIVKKYEFWAQTQRERYKTHARAMQSRMSRMCICEFFLCSAQGPISAELYRFLGFFSVKTEPEVTFCIINA